MDDVKKKFERWRNGRTKNTDRIPNHLWNSAADIVCYYSFKEVAAGLNISVRKLKEKYKQREEEILAKEAAYKEAKIKSNEFAEVNISTALGSTPVSTNSELEFRKTDGSVLVVKYSSEQLILQLLSEFTKVV